jgi:polyhydroxyalkanoate synthase
MEAQGTGRVDAAAAAFVEALHQMSDLVKSTPRIQKLRDDARAQMGATPHDVVYREHSLSVRRYRQPAGVNPSKALPLLIIPSLVNRSDIMDLLPGESMVRWLVNKGHDVYLIDWGVPNPGQRLMKLDHYVDHYIDRVVRRVARESARGMVHVLGYCLGGTLTAMYVSSKHDAPVASAIAMTTPVNFVDRGMLSWWSRPQHFDVDRIVDAFGNVPENFFRTTFPWIVPTGQLRKLKTIMDKHDDDAFLTSFLALDIWITENVPFPGEAYRQLIRELYQENRLMSDTMTVNGRPARLGDMRVPLLVYAAKHDHVAPCESCEALHARSGSTNKALEIVDAGHLGPALGRDAKGKRTDAYWERLHRWLEEDWQ